MHFALYEQTAWEETQKRHAVKTQMKSAGGYFTLRTHGEGFFLMSMLYRVDHPPPPSFRPFAAIK
jgi:hypothetical protein